MRKPKKVILEPDCYPLGFFFWMGNNDHKGIERWLNTKKVILGPLTHAGNNSLGCCWDFGAYQAIYLKHLPTKSNYGTLAHEILHAIRGAARYLNIDDEEFECYMMKYLIDGVMK